MNRYPSGRRLLPPYRLARPHRAHPSIRVNQATPHAVVRATRGERLRLTRFRATVTSIPLRSQGRVSVSKDDG